MHVPVLSSSPKVRQQSELTWVEMTNVAGATWQLVVAPRKPELLMNFHHLQFSLSRTGSIRPEPVYMHSQEKKAKLALYQTVKIA